MIPARHIGIALVVASVVTGTVATARLPQDEVPRVAPLGGWSWIDRPMHVPQRFARAEREQVRQIVVQTALAMNEDPALVQAVAHQESGFNPRAIGPRTRYGRACGLGQFLVSTARQFIPGITCRQLMDPRVNARLTVMYLRQGRQRCGNDVECIARYHHGGPNLRLHGHLTRAYGRAVAAHYRRYGGRHVAPVQTASAGNEHFMRWWLNR